LPADITAKVKVLRKWAMWSLKQAAYKPTGPGSCQGPFQIGVARVMKMNVCIVSRWYKALKLHEYETLLDTQCSRLFHRALANFPSPTETSPGYIKFTN
jgi:hypothetical protein